MKNLQETILPELIEQDAILDAEDALADKNAMSDLVRGSKCGCPVCIRALEIVRGRQK